MSDEAASPDFQGVYLDTNVLMRGQQWPLPSILLNNFLRLAELCGISRHLPEPVLKEAEEHWSREVKEGIAGLSRAAGQLERLAKPVECEPTVAHPSAEILLEKYRTLVDASIRKYGIIRTPFTKRTVEEVFGFATKYLLPFGPKAEGKGFQDAVILLSVLDHLNSFPTDKAIFITSDKDFTGINTDSFIPGFDSKRCQIITLEMAFEFLSKRYYQESIIKPYNQEKENALKAAEANLPEIAEFVQSQVTLDMLKAGLGGKIVKILSFEGAVPDFVETPLPEPDTPDRTVEILLRITAIYRVIIAGGIRGADRLASLKALMDGEPLDFLPMSEEQETYVLWKGGIKATADVVNREFTNVNLLSLVPEEMSLPESTALKARESAQYWMTTKLDDEIIAKTRIPSRTERPKAENEAETHD
ncbi:MAG TPA: PIN domain-containing protein [Candidatus Angelobacter sp.]|nr:PIN domain-containing protein [Candidatus Angelobacter sp.]